MGKIEFIGTGGAMEGDLGDTNIEVNMDGALYFDGADDCVTMGDNDIITTGNFTISAWVKQTAAHDDYGAAVISKQANYNVNSLGWGLYYSQDLGVPYFNVGDGSNGARAGGVATHHLNTEFKSRWIHLAGTYDASSKAMILYQDGVSVGTATATSCGDLSTGNSHHIMIGANGGSPAAGDAFHKGYIADVRVYNYVLPKKSIQILASEINGDPNIIGADGGFTSYVSHWKLNEGTGTAIEDWGNGTDYDGTVKSASSTAAVWHDNVYTVNVMNDTFTTDGTFTVTKGIVDALPLTSLYFDDDDEVIIPNTDRLDDMTQFTVSAWVNRHDYDANERNAIFSKDDCMEIWLKQSASGSAQERLGMSVDNDHTEWFGKNVGSYGDWPGHVSKKGYEAPKDEWAHIVMTFEGTGVTGTSYDQRSLYINGLLKSQTGGNSQWTGMDGGHNEVNTDTVDANQAIGGRAAGSMNSDANIRDVRIYEFALNEDQVACLYSNTFLQRPVHMWKLDDSNQGDNITTAVDTGWAFTGGSGAPAGDPLRNGTLQFDATNGAVDAYTASNWNNFTMDLDGVFTIGNTGTFSAPRGFLDLGVDIIAHSGNGARFTHNNGTLGLNGANMNISSDVVLTAANSSSVYNIKQMSGQSLMDSSSIDMEGDMDIAAGNFTQYHNSTLTCGTDTRASSITGSGQYRFYTLYSTSTLQGKNEAFPVVLNPTTLTMFQNSNNSYFYQIGNVDLTNHNLTSSNEIENNENIKLVGPCQFNAVTIGRGGDLDINGHWAYFGDNLLIQGANGGNVGTLDFGDGGIVQCNADFKCDDQSHNITYGTDSVLWMM